MRRSMILLVGLAALVSACFGGDSVSTSQPVSVTSVVASTTSPTTTSTTVAATTTTTLALPEAMVQTVEFDGPAEDRLLVRYLPENLDGRERPLVVVLHEYAGNAQRAIWPDLKLAAGLGGWIVLAASGEVDSAGYQYWSATPTCCDRDNRRNDDVAYLRGVIQRALGEYSIDRSRVIVVGGSNGGFMAYQLACHASDLVTAIVVTSATEANSEKACGTPYPVSVFHIHGTEDLAVKFAGGELSVLLERIAPYPSAEETVARWSRRDQCPTELPFTTFRVRATRGGWQNCALGTTVDFAWLPMGHQANIPQWLGDEIITFIGTTARRSPRPLE